MIADTRRAHVAGAEPKQMDATPLHHFAELNKVKKMTATNGNFCSCKVETPSSR